MVCNLGLILLGVLGLSLVLWIGLVFLVVVGLLLWDIVFLLVCVLVCIGCIGSLMRILCMCRVGFVVVGILLRLLRLLG